MVQAPSLWGTWMQMNLNDPLFNDRELRYAISLAVDADTLVERVMLGRAQSGKHGWPHLDSTWTKPGMAIPFDIAQSKAGLEAAGMKDADGDGFRDRPDGKPVDLRIVVSTNQPLYVRAAEIMVDQLAVVGLKSHVEAVDTATFNNLTASGNYEFSISEITPHGLADQDQYVQFYSGEQMRKLLQAEPERLAIYERWWQARTREERQDAHFALQDYENRYPSRFMLWYPDGLFAYRWQSYDNYVSTSGYGIYHKYSFLQDAARAGFTVPVDQVLAD
jgi:peptide/nickel transport system substrate-binding protein